MIQKKVTCPHCEFNHKLDNQALQKVLKEQYQENENYEVKSNCIHCNKDFTVNIFYELEPKVCILVEK